jgi:diguanylate cyclase (GGDEF)-like protein/PAS domain S-box-containing protein
VNVLVVSTNEAEVSSLVLAIALRGHSVTQAADSRAAVERLLAERYHLVIIDEVAGGEEQPVALCRQIRGLPAGRHVAIWVITDRGRPEQVAAAIDAGATSFLERPPDVQQLKARLEALEPMSEVSVGASGPAERTDPVDRLVEHLPDAVAIINDDGQIRFISSQVEAILGYTRDMLVGVNCIGLCHPDDVSKLLQQLMATVDHPERFTMVGVRLRRADSAWQDVDIRCRDLRDDPAVGGLLMVIRDDTSRRDREQQLERQAFYDPLTGLANRALFMEHLAQALARSERFNRPIALLYLDLDDFKRVNDNFGHLAGDAVLISVAQQIRSSIRANDIAARLSGDEFVILIEDLSDEEHVRIVARRIQAMLREPMSADGHAILVDASVGIAFSRPGVMTPTALLRDADRALYHAKAQRKGFGGSLDSGLRIGIWEPEATPARIKPIPYEPAAPAPAEEPAEPAPAPAAPAPVTPRPAARETAAGPADAAGLIDRFRTLEARLAQLLGEDES